MTSLPPQRERKPQGRRVWIKRSTIVLPLLCLIIFGTVIGVRLATGSQNAGAETYLPIKGQVPPLVKSSTLVGATDTNQSLSISVGLQLRNAASLKNYVDSTTRKNSINAHRHLSSAQIAAAYAPLASSQQDVIAYLQQYGFQVTTTGKLHLTIGFKGTVGDAENAFHIQINNYRSAKGQNFYAPASDPSVPLDLAGVIQNVAGLNNVVHYSHPPIAKQQQVKANTVKANLSCPADGTQTAPIYYTPRQIAAAYNINGLHDNGLHGEGQTVAVFELDNYSSSAVSTYTQCYGGHSVPINRITVDGGPGNPGDGEAEVELDMELILSAAPNLAALDVYEGPKAAVLTDAQYQDLWSKIITDAAASVISTSWGTCEANDLADLSAENNLFMIAAAQGQTIFAASGDNGTNDCGDNSASVDDPASQPYVTGVGGTSLYMNNGAYKTEDAWQSYDPNDNLYSATGGGISSEWQMPPWQVGPGVNNDYTSHTPCASSTVDAGTGNCREVPDVSLDANPNTGYVVNVAGGWWIFGGTSAGAPMWAAFMALTNEKTLHDGGFNIGFINPYLYQVAQNSTMYANDFHDITTGNDNMYNGGAVYPATTGYDLDTGLGSYNALNLAKDLETLANAKNGSRQAPANTTWYFAEGSVGGNFQEYLTILNPSTTTASVSIQYLFQGSPAKTVTHSVPASSRYTVSANDDLGIPVNGGHQSISAIVTSTVAVVVERPMYFNWYGLKSGTDVLGATNTTSTTFYFAQGDQRQTSSAHSSEFITMLNPHDTPVTVTAKYFSGGQQVGSNNITIPALQRGTISPSYQGQAAIELTADQGIVAERPIYVNDNIPASGGWTTGAASTLGATTPGDDWLFAEGYTGSHFQEYLVLANFSNTDANATVKLEYANGSVLTVQQKVAAQSQVYFNVNSQNTHPDCNLPTCNPNNISAEVTSDAPIVAERVMYFRDGGNIPGMSDVVGTPASHSVYSFAEGYTRHAFQEWLTMQNPNNASVTVAITLFVNGSIIEKEMVLPASSRTTVSINDLVNPMVNAYAPHDGDVSMVVQSFGGNIVVERPMYFIYGSDYGGSDIIGYTGN